MSFESAQPDDVSIGLVMEGSDFEMKSKSCAISCAAYVHALIAQFRSPSRHVLNALLRPPAIGKVKLHHSRHSWLANAKIRLCDCKRGVNNIQAFKPTSL